MAFPMMPGAQFDIVRKMGPDELNKAAMGEYQDQGISPIFALTRIEEEKALAAAFQAKEQKAQQEEQAKMQGVPAEEAPVTILEARLKDRGVVGVDPSADQQLTPEETDALQSGIAGGPTPGGEQTYESWIESNPDALDLSPEAFARSSREEVPAREMMAGGGLIPGYQTGGQVDPTIKTVTHTSRQRSMATGMASADARAKVVLAGTGGRVLPGYDIEELPNGRWRATVRYTEPEATQEHPGTRVETRADGSTSTFADSRYPEESRADWEEPGAQDVAPGSPSSRHDAIMHESVVPKIIEPLADAAGKMMPGYTLPEGERAEPSQSTERDRVSSQTPSHTPSPVHDAIMHESVVPLIGKSLGSQADNLEAGLGGMLDRAKDSIGQHYLPDPREHAASGGTEEEWFAKQSEAQALSADRRSGGGEYERFIESLTPMEREYGTVEGNRRVAIPSRDQFYFEQPLGPRIIPGVSEAIGRVSTRRGLRNLTPDQYRELIAAGDEVSTADVLRSIKQVEADQARVSVEPGVVTPTGAAVSTAPPTGAAVSTAPPTGAAVSTVDQVVSDSGGTIDIDPISGLSQTDLSLNQAEYLAKLGVVSSDATIYEARLEAARLANLRQDEVDAVGTQRTADAEANISMLKDTYDQRAGDTESQIADQQELDRLARRLAGNQRTTFQDIQDDRETDAKTQEGTLLRLMKERDTSSAAQIDIMKGLQRSVQTGANYAADATLFAGLSERLRNPYTTQTTMSGIAGDVNKIRSDELEDLYSMQGDISTSLDSMHTDRTGTYDSIHGIQNTVSQARADTASGIAGIDSGYLNFKSDSAQSVASLQNRLADSRQTTNRDVIAIGTDLLNNRSLDLRARNQIKAAIESENIDQLRTLLASQDSVEALGVSQRRVLAEKASAEADQYVSMINSDEELYEVDKEMSDPANVGNLEQHVDHLRLAMQQADLSRDQDGNPVPKEVQEKQRVDLINGLERRALETATNQYNYWARQADNLGEGGTRSQRENVIAKMQQAKAIQQMYRDRIASDDRALVGMQEDANLANTGILSVGRGERRRVVRPPLRIGGNAYPTPARYDPDVDD
jgi:hypothetical protein